MSALYAQVVREGRSRDSKGKRALLWAGWCYGAQFSELSSVWIWWGILELPSASVPSPRPGEVISANPTPYLDPPPVTSFAQGCSWQIPAECKAECSGLQSEEKRQLVQSCTSPFAPLQGLETDALLLPSPGPSTQPGLQPWPAFSWSLCAWLFLRRCLSFIWIWDEFRTHFNLNSIIF